MNYKTCHFALRNGLFCNAKRPVSHDETGRFRPRNGRYGSGVKIIRSMSRAIASYRSYRNYSNYDAIEAIVTIETIEAIEAIDAIESIGAISAATPSSSQTSCR